MAKKQREICIFGYAAETRDYVHQLPESVEVWGINMANVFLGDKRKGARWYQLHPRDWTTGGRPPTGFWGRPEAHLDFLQAFEGDVWMSYDDPDIPNRRVYSIETVLDDLKMNGRQKSYARHYFTSTFAYIMAQAISEKPSKIYLYGINLTALDEYTKQRNCMEYWIGQAEGRGIEIEIPSESALCKAPDYGLGAKSPQEEIEKHLFDRIQQGKEKYMEAAFDVNTAESMKVETEFWLSNLNQVATALGEEAEKLVASDVDRDGLVAGMRDLSAKTQATIQDMLSKRNNALVSLSQKATSDLNGHLGAMRELQHVNGLHGIVDYRAPALPAVRFPNAAVLSKAFEAPKVEVV